MYRLCWEVPGILKRTWCLILVLFIVYLALTTRCDVSSTSRIFFSCTRFGAGIFLSWYGSGLMGDFFCGLPVPLLPLSAVMCFC